MALTTGVWQAATARTSDSSEKGSRSSIDPPPRVMMMTSTAGSASRRCRLSMTSATAYPPWTATCSTRNRTAGQRRAALRRTSRSAAESRPQIKPISPGRNGSGRLRSAAKRPSAARVRRSRSSRASSSPTPTARISTAERENDPLLALKSGLAQTRTRAPSAGGGSDASSTVRAQITLTDTAATGSRRVRYAVPPRLVSSAICPSTQIRPRRPIQSPTRRMTVRTGTGESAEVSRAMVTGYRLTNGWRLAGWGAAGWRLEAGWLAVGRHSAGVLGKLGQAALEHGDHGRPGLGGPLIFEQGGDLGNAENPQPGAERGDGELVVVGQWQPTLLCYVRSGRLVRG